MAKAKNEAVEIPEGFNGQAGAPEVPEGFEQLTAERVRVWFTKSQGAILHGQLLGRFEGQHGAYYQVRIARSADVTEKVGDDSVASLADVGAIVNVDGHKAIEDALYPLSNDGGKYEIYAIYGEKVKVGGGHTFWPVTVHRKVLKPPTRVTPKRQDEIPF